MNIVVSMTWHPGERLVQTLAGVTEQADGLAGMQQPALMPGGAEFLAAQPWLVIGAQDAAGRMWASVLYGAPGFVRALDPYTVHVAARPADDDPLAETLTRPQDVGAIVLDPRIRTRIRLNGRAVPDGEGLTITLQQAYGNCPKYIATRTPAWAGRQGRPPAVVTDGLDDRARQLLAAADTAFVATRADGAGSDTSHRGGNPGFLHVEEDTVTWPDYQGNNMFNTLGNLQLDEHLGLTVVDPADGTTLQLSGRAEVLWEPRRVALRVDRAVRREQLAPLTWTLERAARNPPVAART